MTDNKVVAIIPARAGSKRIPNKNIKLFCAEPVITYSIKAALKTKLFDRVIVSTDSNEIAAIAEASGAEVPFTRPLELADDFTGTASVMLHALNWLSEHGVVVSYFCCIYATAPLVQPEYIIKGLTLLKEKNAAVALSVTTYSYPIFRSLKINTDGFVKMIWPEHENARSNDLTKAYHDAGQFYWGNAEKFIKEKTFFGPSSVPVVIPRYLAQDIDTDEDWQTAEKMYSLINISSHDRS